MVQHMAGITNDFGAHVADAGLAMVDLDARGFLRTHPAPDVGVIRLDPQYRRGDLCPASGDRIGWIKFQCTFLE